MQDSSDVESEDDIEQSKIEVLEAEIESLRSQLRPQAQRSKLRAPRQTRRQTMILAEIRKRDRVLVDLVHHQLHLNSEIGFKAVFRSEVPHTSFEDELAAMEVLRDVAEVMNVYCKATVLVEGHTATPPDKMDDWAHARANDRASFIKSKLEYLGIDAHRVTTVGLPGYLGCGKPSIKFKIISYGEQPDEPNIFDKAAIAAMNLKSEHNAEIKNIKAEYSHLVIEGRAASQKKIDQLKSEITKLSKQSPDGELYGVFLEQHTKKTEALEHQLQALQAEARQYALEQSREEQGEIARVQALQEHTAQAVEHAAHAANHQVEMQELGKQLEYWKSEASAAAEMLETERSLQTTESEKLSLLTACVEELQTAAEAANAEENRLRTEVEQLRKCASEAEAKDSELARESQDEQATTASEILFLRQRVESLQNELAESEGARKQCEERDSKARFLEQELAESSRNLMKENNELKVRAAAEAEQLKTDCVRQVEEAHAAAKSEILRPKAKTRTLQAQAANAESHINVNTRETQTMQEVQHARFTSCVLLVLRKSSKLLRELSWSHLFSALLLPPLALCITQLILRRRR